MALPNSIACNFQAPKASKEVENKKPKLVDNGPVIGYKGFQRTKDPNKFKCINFEFEKGVRYFTGDEPVLCKTGFHYCEKLEDVDTFYSFENSNNIFFKVRATGKKDFSLNNDKSVAQGIELLEEVSQKSLNTLIIKENLLIYLELQKNNPNLMLGGSLSLFLRGHLKIRPLGDIDVINPYYTSIAGCYPKGRDEWDGNDTVHKFVHEKTNTKVDMWVDPYSSYTEVSIGGQKIKLINSDVVWEAKMKYARQAAHFTEGDSGHKHARDVVEYLTNKLCARPNKVSHIRDIIDESLLFGNNQSDKNLNAGESINDLFSSKGTIETEKDL